MTICPLARDSETIKLLEIPVLLSLYVLIPSIRHTINTIACHIENKFIALYNTGKGSDLHQHELWGLS